MASPVFSVTHADLSSASNPSSLTSESWSVSGNNRFLLAGIGSAGDPPEEPASVKWGGSEGTDLTKQGDTLSVHVFGKVALYTLVAPTEQTSTSYYSWAAATDEAAGGTILITGVNQSTPIGTIATATGSGEADMTPSVSVTSEVDDLVVAICWMVDTSAGSRTITSGDGTTTVYDVQVVPYQYLIIGTKVATSTTTTLDFTISGTANSEVDWGVIGVPVKPVASLTALPRRAFDGPFYGSLRGSVR